MKKGFKHSELTKQKISLSCIKNAKRNLSSGMKGKHHNEITKLQISNSCHNNAKINPNYGTKGKIVSKETKIKLSESHRGKKFSDEIKQKMRKRHIPMSEETKIKIGKANAISQLGYKQTKEHKERVIRVRRKNGWWKNPDDTKKKMSFAHKGKSMSEEAKLNMSKSQIGKKLPEETILKMRISRFNYIKNVTGAIHPNIGKYEKQILDEVQNTIGFSIKRAFYINGYFLDGYCQELNLAIEIDEEYHYNEKQKHKDIEKQNSIMKSLNCNFLRIRVKEFIKNEKIDIIKLHEKMGEVKMQC